MMPKIFLLCGVPASGKSTFVENNRGHFEDDDGSFFIASSDAIIEAEAEKRGLTYDEYFKEGIAEADEKFFEAIDAAIANEMNLVVDRVNLSVKSRRRILSRIPDHYERYAICFETPEYDEWTRRLNNRPGKTIPQSVIDSFLKNAQYPTYDEGFDVIEKVYND